MILVIDTAREEVTIGLWDGEWRGKEDFLGGRQLNSLIIQKLDSLNVRTSEVTGIIVAAGPGSFTGLRIGMSVANTIAYTRDIPIVAPAETGSIDELLQKGLDMLESAGSQFAGAVTPHYGAEPHITQPKHQ